MPSPKQGYRTADGERVPSVTTIIAKFKEAGGLIHWAWQLGIDGKDYREVRDQAAGIGTMAHTLVENWIHGAPLVVEHGSQEDRDKAHKAFGAFLQWADQSRLAVTHTEVGLVSEKHRYGGTLDAAITVNNARALGDWKTSAKIYPEALIQLAAYGNLWNEHHPEDQIVGGFHLMRFDKEHGDFTHKWWGELDRAWQAFLRMRDLYEDMKELSKRAA